MARPALSAVGRPEVPPLAITPRLRTQLPYFGAEAGGHGMPALGPDDYYFEPEAVAKWLDEGVLSLVSPLDTANMTEVELSEEQEALLEWITAHGVRHARVG